MFNPLKAYSHNWWRENFAIQICSFESWDLSVVQMPLNNNYKETHAAEAHKINLQKNQLIVHWFPEFFLKKLA